MVENQPYLDGVTTGLPFAEKEVGVVLKGKEKMTKPPETKLPEHSIVVDKGDM
jgi:hypothetical protein